MKVAVLALSLISVTAILPTLVCVESAMAKPPSRAEPDLADVVFTEIEKRLIREYYAQNQAAVPAAQLPPGIQKRLARGKPLPPGIAKRYLPQDLEARLPARSGVIRQVVGHDVLLVATATNIVLDILFDVIRR